jgi:hypothetical protein
MSVVWVRVPPVLLRKKTAMTTPRPSDFKTDTFIAECVETHMGERFIMYHHPNNTVYAIKNAALFSPFKMAAFAAWTMKAAEWVADSKRWTKEIKPKNKKKKNKKDQTCQVK